MAIIVVNEAKMTVREIEPRPFYHELLIDPVPRPRMTRKDKWANRPCVQRYFAFRDLVRLMGPKEEDVPDELMMTFYVPMPKSWSKKKKRLMAGKPHRQKPDIDNFVKGLLDALLDEDKRIYRVDAAKYWSYTGSVVLQEPFHRHQKGHVQLSSTPPVDG